MDPSRRPYPVAGTWERYAFRAGNVLFLMMSDRNDFAAGSGRNPKGGGYPSGAVTGETFAWWQEQVEKNPDSIIVSAHHHMLKETTVASGPWEGYRQDENGAWRGHYHGYFADGGPAGASYLYFLDDKPDAQAFEGYLASSPVQLTCGSAATPIPIPTTGTAGGRNVESKWNVNFINCAALARHHAGRTTLPMSRLLTFTAGSDEVACGAISTPPTMHRKAGMQRPNV